MLIGNWALISRHVTAGNHPAGSTLSMCGIVYRPHPTGDGENRSIRTDVADTSTRQQCRSRPLVVKKSYLPCWAADIRRSMAGTNDRTTPNDGKLLHSSGEQRKRSAAAARSVPPVAQPQWRRSIQNQRPAQAAQPYRRGLPLEEGIGVWYASYDGWSAITRIHLAALALPRQPAFDIPTTTAAAIPCRRNLNRGSGEIFIGNLSLKCKNPLGLYGKSKI